MVKLSRKSLGIGWVLLATMFAIEIAWAILLGIDKRTNINVENIINGSLMIAAGVCVAGILFVVLRAPRATTALFSFLLILACAFGIFIIEITLSAAQMT